MQIDTLLSARREEILQIATVHGAGNIRVFGSLARGEAHRGSDVDVLVELESGRSLLDLVAIKQDLEDLLGCDVDVVTEASISPYIRDQVLQEAITLCRGNYTSTPLELRSRGVVWGSVKLPTRWTATRWVG